MQKGRNQKLPGSTPYPAGATRSRALHLLARGDGAQRDTHHRWFSPHGTPSVPGTICFSKRVGRLFLRSTSRKRRSILFSLNVKKERIHAFFDKQEDL